MSRAKPLSHVIVAGAVLLFAATVISHSSSVSARNPHQNSAVANATQKVESGEQTFRFDTGVTK